MVIEVALTLHLGDRMTGFRVSLFGQDLSQGRQVRFLPECVLWLALG